MNDDESLLNDFLEAARLEPDDPLVLFGLATEYLKLNRYDEAISTSQHLIEVQKEYSAAYRLLGQAYTAKGNTVAAIETYEAGIVIAENKGDLQTKKEMEVFLHRLQK
ncbi:MAG: hypothetical protein C5B54_04550 [Acidobacteria bacterium]|nr:MAG: hypothetical protein C5B54_04550 [Acidobacteriota bacterium]